MGKRAFRHGIQPQMLEFRRILPDGFRMARTGFRDTVSLPKPGILHMPVKTLLKKEFPGIVDDFFAGDIQHAVRTCIPDTDRAQRKIHLPVRRDIQAITIRKIDYALTVSMAKNQLVVPFRLPTSCWIRDPICIQLDAVRTLQSRQRELRLE